MRVLITTLLIWLGMAVLSQVHPAQNPPLNPPWHFDYPYRGVLTVHYVLPTETHAKCVEGANGVKGMPPGWFVRACATPAVDGSWCDIIFPADVGVYPKPLLERLMRHELAHCNGWNAQHNN